MKMKQLTPEEIETNFEEFKSLLKKLGDREAPARRLVDALGERLALCPASAKLEHHSAYAGGLIEHSTRVLRLALALRKTLGVQVPVSSVILVSLFHDLGKVGNETSDFYLPQDSDWHKEKLGEVYKYNKSLQFMTVPHRSIYLLQLYGVTLTQDEFISIMIHDGQYADENRPYRMKETKLANLIHMADCTASNEEKEEYVTSV